jgi:hypothetical protein
MDMIMEAALRLTGNEKYASGLLCNFSMSEFGRRRREGFPFSVL